MVLQSTGSISFSQIRNEIGGPSATGPISLSQYTTSNTFGSVLASNPNGIPSTNNNISFSKFYSASKWSYPTGTYTATQQLATIGNTINQDTNAQQIWINGDPYQYAYAPISGSGSGPSYPVNFYYIYQNTTGSSLPTTIYSFQDDNMILSLNNSTIANYTYGANTLSTTLNVGQNLLKAYVTNTGGPGTFQMTLKNSTGNTLTYTNTNWVVDAQCILHYYNWSSAFTVNNASGTAPSLTGTDPDKQYQLGFSTGGTMNRIYNSSRIQDYSTFTLYFEIYVTTGSAADGLFSFIGATNNNTISEGGGNNAFTLAFQIYTGGGLSQGIYLRNGAGTIVASYLTSGFIASTWQPVYVYYTKGTTNTWNCYWNGINIFNYSDTSNATYITNSGSYYGFGFRDGGSVGSGYIRHVELYHRA